METEGAAGWEAVLLWRGRVGARPLGRPCLSCAHAAPPPPGLTQTPAGTQTGAGRPPLQVEQPAGARPNWRAASASNVFVQLSFTEREVRPLGACPRWFLVGPKVVQPVIQPENVSLLEAGLCIRSRAPHSLRAPRPPQATQIYCLPLGQALLDGPYTRWSSVRVSRLPHGSECPGAPLCWAVEPSIAGRPLLCGPATGVGGGCAGWGGGVTPLGHVCEHVSGDTRETVCSLWVLAIDIVILPLPFSLYFREAPSRDSLFVHLLCALH